MYGSKCLPLSKAYERMLNIVETRMLRWACGFTRCDKGPNEHIRTIMQTAPIQLKLRAQRLRWYGHVMRKASPYPTRQAMEIDADGKHPEAPRRSGGRTKYGKIWKRLESRKTTPRTALSVVGEPTQRTLRLGG
ncbi:hypothetical protein Y032_0045g1133 [Ancylostoma ceylanicum]|uniref:Reverse transcriptase domain-containing protein n=1 Tax=Ancylostoma ceylanicum TaxID=53326 RepID=A0A016UCI2_9BILA|nr:hypothetical protein Y032_0045g1133 [Ancylostoma ceylanicum]